MSTRKTKAQLEADLKEAQLQIAELQRALHSEKNIGGDPTHGLNRQDEAANNSQSEQKLRQLLDVLPVGISILNEQKQVVFQNSALLTILDMDPDNLQSGAYKNWEYLAADGSPMPADGFASVQAQKSGQAVYNVETGIVKENGETIWTSVSAVPMDFTDWKTVVVTADVTARKQAEKNTELQYRRLKVLREMELEILRATSSDHIIKAALQHIRQLIDCQRSNLTFFDWGMNESIVYDVNTITETAVPKGARFPLQQYQDLIEIFSRNQVLPIPDLNAMADPRPLSQSLLQDGLRSLISVPLVSQDKLIGMLTVHSTLPNFFDEEKVSLVQEVANHVAIAISQAQLLQQIEDELIHRNQSEHAYTHLTERLSLATRSAKMGIWDWDIQKNELFWDNQMYALYGLRTGEFAGAYEAWLNGVYPDDREASNEVSTAALRGEREYDTEFRVLWPDGSVHWLKANGLVFRDAKGTPLRMVGVNYDISDDKQAEQNLQKSEQRFVTIFENSPVAIGISRMRDRKLIHANQAFLSLYGFSREETLGHTTAELGIWADPDERRRFVEYLQEKNQVHGMEAVARQRSGNQRNVLVWGEIVEINDEPCMVAQVVDITERKQAVEKLQESEERFSIAFQASPVAQSITALADGEIMVVNDACCRLFEYSRDELIGHSTSKLDLWGNPADEEAVVQELIATGHLLPKEVTIRTRSGSLRTILASIEPLSWKGIPCFITSTIDITELKQAQEKFAESEERFSIAFHASPVSQSIMTQGTSKIMVVNDACCRLFEYSRDELIGEDTSKLHLWENPADREAVVQEMTATGHLLPREVTIRTRSGNARTILASIEPIMWKGVPSLISSIIDITDRKLVENELRISQKLLQDIIDNTSALVYVMDTEGRFLLANRKLENLFRCSNAEIIGKTRNAFIPEKWALEHRTNDMEIIQSEQERIFEEENLEPDGRHVYLTTKFPLYDMKGNVYAVCGISTDMTDRKQMEEDLRRSNSELEQFAYVASHDLQEPLRAVAGMVELLAQRYKGKLDDRADTYITHAVDASQRMQKLINDLLEYSRVTRFGKSFEATSIESVLQAALRNLSTAIEESHTQITHDPLPTVMADSVQLTQVMQNLIANAIKFRSERTPQIHISAQKTGNEWRIAVHDNGIGIDPQYFDRIFLIFQRLHTRRTYPGTGIGLSLCKKIIDRHGGTIGVESVPDEGSTFYFTLPEAHHESTATQTS